LVKRYRGNPRPATQSKIFFFLVPVGKCWIGKDYDPVPIFPVQHSQSYSRGTLFVLHSDMGFPFLWYLNVLRLYDRTCL
jgi:hypothetical protein